MKFLGVDVGASKTHALLCDAEGKVLGFSSAQGGNPETVGYAGLTLAMQAAIQQALFTSGIAVDEITVAGFGIAGYDWPHQYPEVLAAVQSLGLINAQLIIENDAIPPIMAGTNAGWGISACVGTGNNVRGVDQQGRTARITGNSAAFGEYGGASEIMQSVLPRLAWMWTGRGKHTTLAEILVADCEASDLADLLEGLVQGKYQLSANQAPLVVQAAMQGDLVAIEVVTWNAEELAQSVLAVARQLDLLDIPFDVVMSGHLFEAAVYQQAFRSKVFQSAQKAQFQLLSLPPVVGAVLLAIRANGLDIQKPRAGFLTTDFSILLSKIAPKIRKTAY